MSTCPTCCSSSAPCWWSPAGAARARPYSRCSRWPACCARRRGPSRGLYWLYLMRSRRARELALRRPRDHGCSRCSRWRGPLVWLLSDLAITGEPAVVADQHPPHGGDARPGQGDRRRAPNTSRAGSAKILRPPVLVGAALGGVLSLLWLRRRALVGAAAGVLSVVVFRGIRHARAADQHPLRLPRRGDPGHLRWRRRIRLDAPAARGPPGGGDGWPPARSC